MASVKVKIIGGRSGPDGDDAVDGHDLLLHNRPLGLLNGPFVEKAIEMRHGSFNRGGHGDDGGDHVQLLLLLLLLSFLLARWVFGQWRRQGMLLN